MTTYKLDKTCPTCGIRISDGATYCPKHRGAHWAKPENYICPICGGPKSRGERNVCMKCKGFVKQEHHVIGWNKPNFDYSRIPDEWWIAFTNLFLGEGSALLKWTNAGSIAAGLCLGLRADDKAVVEDIKTKLGGSLHLDSRHGKNPAWRWNIGQVHKILAITSAMLSHFYLPAKKIKEIQIVHDFCIWRLTQHFRCTDYSVAEQMLQELRSSRVFKLQG